jgi:hypothetical protein
MQLCIIEYPWYVPKGRSLSAKDFTDMPQFLLGSNPRWKAVSGMMMAIPKCRKVWNKTKDIHSSEFRAFIDSL